MHVQTPRLVTGGILACVALTGACGVVEPDTIEVIGTVRVEGLPAEGWQVRAQRVRNDGEYSSVIDIASAATDIDGNYRIEIEPCGGAWLEIGRPPPGDVGGADPIAPPNGRFSSEQLCAGHARYDFELGRTRVRIFGTAMSWSEPASGATVTVRGPVTRLAEVDSNGLFDVDSLPWGEYTISIEAEGAASRFPTSVTRTLRPGSSSIVLRGRPEPGPTFVSLTAGSQATCGLTTASEVFCWGWWYAGSRWPSFLGTPTRLGGGQAWVLVIPVINGGCALSEAGAAYCWGQSTSGWASAWHTPTLVPGGLSWLSLDATIGHACGVSTAGDLYCWGDPGGGEPAHGPEEVGAGIEWAVVGVGGQQDCGLTATGEAYCWYYAGWAERRLAPELVSGGHRWVSLSVGGSHTCGITDSAAAYCWGKGTYGELGNGSSADHPEPALVSGGIRWRWIGVNKDNQAGPEHHTCGISDGGAAFCWGSNQSGQLGSGQASAPRLHPTPVSSAARWVSLSVGYQHTCGVTESDELYCWGGNDQGPIGDGTHSDRPEPTIVGTGWEPLVAVQP